MTRRLRWYRYRAVIVGMESGHRTTLDFVRWRHRAEADAWCAKMNHQHPGNGLTRWEYEPIR